MRINPLSAVPIRMGAKAPNAQTLPPETIQVLTKAAENKVNVTKTSQSGKTRLSLFTQIVGRTLQLIQIRTTESKRSLIKEAPKLKNFKSHSTTYSFKEGNLISKVSEKRNTKLEKKTKTETKVTIKSLADIRSTTFEYDANVQPLQEDLAFIADAAKKLSKS